MHLEAVRERIGRAAARAGRDPAGIRIVAVTKTHPIATVRLAVEHGVVDIGENKVQEALAKQEAWPAAAVRWHLIGHLQRNKAKLAVGAFALIHSVDSLRLADALERAGAEKGVVQDVLMQVNVAREPQKGGVLPGEAEALAVHIAAQPHLALKGLMTMAPFTDDEAPVRETFRGLRELKASLDDRLRGSAAPAAGESGFTELSMGMSQDFEIAIEEGATMLRLGTVLFGERGT